MTWYYRFLVILAVALLYTNLPNYIGHVAIHSTAADTAPKFWIIGFTVLSMPVLIGQLLKLKILKSPLIIWCFGFAWVTAAWFFLAPPSDMPWQEVRWRALAIIELTVMLLVFTDPGAIRFGRQALVVAVLFGVALNIYDFFVPMSFSFVRGRSAGLYLNPNRAGIALIFGMLLTVTVLPFWSRSLFILLTGIGVFTTVSRGSILMWVMAVMGLMFMGKVSLKNLLLPVSTILLVVALVLLPRWNQVSSNFEGSGVNTKDVQERLDWFMNPFVVSDDSGWEHKYLAEEAWEKVAEHPFLGKGTGASREAVIGAHNQYLMFMQDHGLFVGGAILPLFVLAVIWRARGDARGVLIIFGGAVMLTGLFSHEMFKQDPPLLLYALAAAMASGSRENKIEKTVALKARGTNASRLRSVPQPLRSSTEL